MGIKMRVLLGALTAALCGTALAAAVFAGSHEVSENFGGAQDGVRTVTSSGQPVSLYPDSGPRTPRVEDGWLTFDANEAIGGGYYTVKLSGPAQSVGAEFAFTPWSMGGGLLCIAFMETDIAKSSPVVPRSPMHFTISPEAWGIDVFDVQGGTARQVAKGLFDTPLVSDGTTLHRVSIELDGDTATVKLPNGETVTATDPAIALHARYVFLEPWRTEDDTTNQTLPKVRSWWADPDS